MTRARLGIILTVLGCADPTASYEVPATSATLETRQQNNSYSFRARDRTVYVRITSARGGGGGGEPIRAFMRRMFESADAAGATRLVLDLRSVSGSDTFLLVPLLKGLMARDRFVKRDGLLVFLGRDSFSQAQNAATLLQRYANPTFVAPH
jgi:hypothetical protein